MTSIQKKLSKVRKPRVHITYDVETEGAAVIKELPFVVGVLGDFSGDPTEPLKAFKERKFINIDNDNFDQVMQKMHPGLKLKVANTLADDDSETAVELRFNKLDDFEPGNVAEQVPALKNLIATRNKLNDLLSKADCSENLESILEKILNSNDDLKTLAKDLGVEATATEEDK